MFCMAQESEIIQKELVMKECLGVGTFNKYVSSNAILGKVGKNNVLFNYNIRYIKHYYRLVNIDS